ncbi:MAG: helix-turn-helix transcriptional regulator [Dehalococcoidia bacterium]|jgi:DNA-binding CsgD family transcriptional regulator|uniref:response regulator transcription factor n=2 Tax=Candidatus Amarobacter glycogenicus TaxID=3140699 RepID=UPI001D1B48F9|nr:helix-turn-helix transcriptional regulator [Dehalococcoidia bacterium]MBK7725540.1 helix-turn-helix transcriptional regulator [Dehalococcoidia bacterium]MBK8560883.1 helix-turn-helix transcriptional regulator [Dehalococcoidia bacterium]
MSRPRAANEPSVRFELSPRQQEVLGLIARGCTNGEIADRLGITLDGVKWHVSEILARLDVPSREEAVVAWQQRQRANRLARVRSLVPAWFSLKALSISGASVAGVVGAAVVVGAIREGAPAGPSDEGPGVAVAAAPTPTQAAPTAIVLPAGIARPCIPGELMASSSRRLDGDTAVAEFVFTKPRTCDLIEFTEAFVVATGETPQGKRLATRAGALIAPAGTDQAIVTVRWKNWCEPVPTPVPEYIPTVVRNAQGQMVVLDDPDAPRQFDHVPLWYFHDIDTQSGIGASSVYPPCTDASKGPSIEVSVRAVPDPPAPVPALSAVPAVTGPADVSAFARWFEAAVSARDDSLRDITRAFDASCSGAPHPFCTTIEVAGAQGRFIMSQSGQLGSADAFASQLNRTTAASGPLRAIGCATDAPPCTLFVLAFEAIPGNGPGSYQAYVFEVEGGVASLRGIYPGGGDVATVFSGGETTGPWGRLSFAPAP